VGVLRWVFNDCSNFEVVPLFYVDKLAYWVGITKIFAGQFFCEDQIVGFIEACGGVSIDKFVGEDVENRRISKENLIFVEYPILVLEQGITGPSKSGKSLDLGEFLSETGAQCWRSTVETYGLARCYVGRTYAVDAAGFLMVAVISQFMLQVEKNNDSASNASRDTKDIEKIVKLVLFDEPVCEFKAFSDHTFTLLFCSKLKTLETQILLSPKKEQASFFK
jgi:hypothetical protein